ncbi:DNA polymerase family A [Rubrobacter radiotolerans]|uniref:DNA polymerase I n=1 Tax=Rubrobacter radiotolerans TaxID=42256 RepID=A0A023X3Q5_RUBRA|nr:DNA polymerase I [Rubrobacter radiotolerans]AHY47087.1 DNA polymerase family A [Rubrobacter radiotolerans]MDX5894492.1 DNA polymerase I [Rubrobacter radiotolerans]SMC06116.1 DNA polymerase I [Rubrobacter radiotolerans DSM 5868]
MRIYLIDGYSLLYRAFYALPQSISTSGGLPTNALYGFTSMVLKLLDTEEPVGIGVVWDGGMPEYRTEIFPEYKANRSAMPEELRMQLDHLDEILSAMNIHSVRVEGFEADDVIATLSKKVPEGVELEIVTGDQDAMQLVEGAVKVARTTRGVSELKEYTRETVIEEYGVTPEQIPDYKGLVGDSSDNIPGVRGIGPKGASKLLQEFGSVEEIYANLDAVKAKGTKSKLEEGRESAFLSKELATMRYDVPVEFDAEGLKFEGVSPAVDEVVRRYEFRSLGQRLSELPTVGGERLAPPERLKVSVSEEPVDLSFEAVAVAPVGDGRWCVAETPTDVRLVEELPNRPLRVHDAKKNRVRDANFDTYLAAYLIRPGLGSYEVEAMAEDRGLAGVDVEHADERVAAAAQRAAVVQALSPKLHEELEELGLARLYYDVELPLADVLADLEDIGMPVDADTLAEVGKEVDGRLATLEAEIHRMAGRPFNIGSPKQLGEVLFEEMGIPPVRKTKTGYSTDAKVLNQLELQGHEIARLIVEWRELAKLKGTYVEGLGKLIGPDGRIHTTLNQTTTTTGRISSDTPNLQNIPIRTETGQRIRDAFTSSPGRKLLVVDYSQIELRILAHMTGEPTLVAAFRNGEDIHTRTAAEVFDIRPESVTPELRRRAKMVNFGVLYGISGFGLATRLGLDRVNPAEADEYIRRYFESYPKVTEFIEETFREARERAEREGSVPYVTTLFGRRRYVPELVDRKKNVQKLGERFAFNARVQGTAADIMKVAMIDLAPRVKSLGADMIMQVHDELVFDVDEEAVRTVAELAAERMVAAYDLDPPLEVEAKVGERWGRGEPLALAR